MVKFLDDNLYYYVVVIKVDLGRDLEEKLGVGVVGGLGIGFLVFINVIM